jgi:hypothetical protein
MMTTLLAVSTEILATSHGFTGHGALGAFLLFCAFTIYMR